MCGRERRRSRSSFEQVAIGYLDLLLNGGTLHVLGSDVDILGLRNAQGGRRRDAARAAARLAAAAPRCGRSPQFAELAIDNLGVSNDVLRSVGHAGEGQADDRRRPAHAARHVRGGDRGDRLADVPDACCWPPACWRSSARRTPSRASCAGSSRASGCSSRRSGSPRCARSRSTLRCCWRLGALRHRPRLGALPAVAARARRRRARVRGAGRGDRRPRARGARRVAARVPAVAAARVPRARPDGRGLRRALRRDPRGLGGVPVQGRRSRRSTRRSTTPSRRSLGPLLHLLGLTVAYRRDLRVWPCGASPDAETILQGDGLPRHPAAPAAPHRRRCAGSCARRASTPAT